MVRTYKRKTERASIYEKCVDDAVSAVIKVNVSIRAAAKASGLKPSMLFNRVSKFCMLYKEPKETYLRPPSMNRKFCSKKPENTSINTSLGFNKANIDVFKTNLENILHKFEFTPEKTYNLDKTGIINVLQAPKVIASSGEKQVRQTVSSERGELVTFCGIVNALGNTIPPFYVFPRKCYKELLLKGAPSQSLGLVHTTGWMTADNFLETVKHFQKFCHCKEENLVLLLIDNHECHASLEVIMFCRENAIVLLTFPSHCSHKLQPLDVSVYGSFKTVLKIEFNDWLTTNAGKRISVYEIAELSAIAYYQTFTIRNIRSGFSKPGIWPFSRNVFAENDFLADIMTDQKAEEDIPSISGHFTETNAQAETVDDDLNSNVISTCPMPESI
ncbi:hypothetical protein AVEN_102860-1 [Araneus ventricosus]|uniref:DDE-1 domain-containing protein n=1 Tax=Araneus ventricosus TaxID=182803 RepID=A0A4Y2LBV6_ARAVE|nr:hypothetical protein AVEN_102860-1 [Araneus ventricosus]